MKKNLEGKPADHCGLFAIYGNNQAALLTYQGLKSLNHRGHDSAGIVVTDGVSPKIYSGPGYVESALDKKFIKTLKFPIAMGHVRYGTSAISGYKHVQPVERTLKDGRKFYLGHNGNIPSVKRLGRLLELFGMSSGNMSDSEMLTSAMVPYLDMGASELDAFKEISKSFDGAYTVEMLLDDRLTIIKDAYGNKPGGYGLLPQGGFLISSESCGAAEVGGVGWTEIGPGQAVIFDKDGMHQPIQLFTPNPKFHIFELIYFMRDDSIIDSHTVGEFRRASGRQLFKEHPTDADFVVPIMKSGEMSGVGFSEASGIPLLYALKKNKFAGRTFIAADQTHREGLVNSKFKVQYLNKLKNKKAVTIDDSQVRGTTTPRTNKLLIKSGARAVDNRFASPEVMWEDKYGNMDIRSRDELIAYKLQGKEMEKRLGCETYGYLSLKGLKKVIKEVFGTDPDNYSYACFDGNYPIPIEEKTSEIAPNFKPTLIAI